MGRFALIMLLSLVPLLGFAQRFEVTWTQRIDYNRSDYGYAIAQRANGGFVVTGSTRPVSESATAYIQLISPSGGIGFNHIFDEGDDLGGFRDIISTNDNGYIAAGRGGNSSEFVVMRSDSTGNVDWIFESPFDEGLMMEAQVLETIDDQILVVETGGSTSFGDNHLIKLNSIGDT
ncbi:hypothetical protein KKC97_12310, partial [bacterium]|nr:hypothetical protein [bacterium]